jgi:hypothetical protein
MTTGGQTRSRSSTAMTRLWNPTASWCGRLRTTHTHTRTKGVRHLFAAYDLGEDRLYGHIKPRKTRTRRAAR